MKRKTLTIWLGIAAATGMLAFLINRSKKNRVSEADRAEDSKRTAAPVHNDGITESTNSTAEEVTNVYAEPENVMPVVDMKEETPVALPKTDLSGQQPDVPKTNVQASRRIGQYDDEMNLIAEYESAGAAAKSLGSSRTSIRNAAGGKQKHAAGYIWKYLD